MATRNRVKDTDSDIVAFVDTGVRQGLRPAKIREKMKGIKGFDGRIPETRALQRLVADLIEIHGGNPTSVGLLEEPFEWSRLEEYGLPWESSSYILEIWVEQINHPAHRDTNYSSYTRGRDSRWWWRIHQADPDMDSVGVAELAKCFASKEYYRDVLGLPLTLSDLEAMLAYKPWASSRNSERYLKAVRDGIIPRLQGFIISDAEYDSAFKTMPFDSQLRNKSFFLMQVDQSLNALDARRPYK